jgi:hypothetical protein
MTAYSWTLGSGNWNIATNWTPLGGPPTSGDDATIATTGSNYTVTINSADAAHSLAITSANAAINDTGTLTITTNLSLSSATFNDGGGTLIAGMATISGDFTNNGTFDLSDRSSTTPGNSTISGTLNNNGTMQFGYGALSVPVTLTLGGLTNATSGASFHLNGTAIHAATLAFSGGGTGFTSNAGDFELTYAAALPTAKVNFRRFRSPQ